MTHEEGTVMLLDSETEEAVPAGGSSAADPNAAGVSLTEDTVNTGNSSDANGAAGSGVTVYPNQGASLAEGASSKPKTEAESTGASCEAVGDSLPDEVNDSAVTERTSSEERNVKAAEEKLLNEGQPEVQELVEEAKEEVQSDVTFKGQVGFYAVLIYV